MATSVLAYLHFGLLLFFGIFVSAVFADIPLNRRNVVVLLVFGVGGIALQCASYLMFGMQITQEIYPFIIHLPIILLFVFYFHLKPLFSIYAVLSAYLCCQISKWLATVASHFFASPCIYYVVYILFSAATFLLIVFRMVPSIAVIAKKSNKTLIIFGLLPAAYYVFDYCATIYTNLLYDGSKVVFEFLPFVLSISYLAFCFIYFKEYEEKCEISRRNQMMELQKAQSEKEIAAIRRAEHEIALVRHDMRHFLTNISYYIQNGEQDKADTYIQNIIDTSTGSALKKYCSNDLINMILSSYERKIEQRQIRLDCSIQIPDQLPCSEVDFTSIFSNGLENAIHAVSHLDLNQRVVTLRLWEENQKLLLSIKNPCPKRPKMENGLPVTSAEGHGFGTQSIQYVTEKLNGNCQFMIQDGFFILRVAI